MFRLKGKGIPRLDGHGRGDQLVRVVAWVPEKVSKKEEELLKELDKSLLHAAPRVDLVPVSLPPGPHVCAPLLLL